MNENNLKIPPGIYGHLGLLYFKNANLQKSKDALSKEADLYPESRHFINIFSGEIK